MRFRKSRSMRNYHVCVCVCLCVCEREKERHRDFRMPSLRISWCILRWGWVFLKQTRILSGIQFTTHFIEIFVVETKRFVVGFVNVILTRQTCGQRSSRAAESKRRALGNYFSERICYMFLMSKCGGEWDLGLCTTSVLAFGEPMRNGTSEKKNVFRRRKNRILPLCEYKYTYTHNQKHIHEYLYIYIYIHIYMYIYMYIYMCRYIFIFTYLYIYIFIYMYTCVNV